MTYPINQVVQFEVPAPPSLNAMYRFSGRTMYKTKECKQWIRDAAWSIAGQCAGTKRPLVSHSLSLTITVQPRDGRLRDIDNYVKATADLLEEINMIENDKWITELHVKRLEPNYREHTIAIILKSI